MAPKVPMVPPQHELFMDKGRRIALRYASSLTKQQLVSLVQRIQGAAYLHVGPKGQMCLDYETGGTGGADFCERVCQVLETADLAPKLLSEEQK